MPRALGSNSRAGRPRPASYGDFGPTRRVRSTSAICWYPNSLDGAATNGSFRSKRRNDRAIQRAPGDQPGARAIEKPAELEREFHGMSSGIDGGIHEAEIRLT